ncbi:MAG: hypothetical protein HY046_04240 [Acidobacteria bacterium]|nr:hypothetical protein [Acidobacteriota bacterium]
METVSAKAIRLPIEKAFIEMEKQGIREMRREGYSAEQIRIERLLDIRYVGQSYELSIPAAGDFVRAFHREHEKRYGYSETTRPVEIINIRARVIGSTPKPKLPRFRVVVRSSGAAEMHKRKVMFGGRWLETRIFNRDKLRAGMRIRGPAIITEYSATTVVPPRWKGHVDAVGNIVLVRQ